MSGWTGPLVAVAVLVVATGGGLLLRRRNGLFRAVAPGRDAPGLSAKPIEAAIDPMLASLGVIPGTPVTLLQFSSAFCAPCRTTRVLCADVAERVPGVRHVELDAESHLEAVRALDIWRTPTVLVIDADGTVRRRASGAPTRAQLLAAVAEVLPESEVVTSRMSE